MNKHFDELEIRDPKKREQALFRKLPKFLEEIRQTVPAWNQRLAKIDVKAVKNREKLAMLPVLRKTDLMEAQRKRPPFGGFAQHDLVQGTRVFMSPGPVWEPQPPGLDPWGAARAFFAAGIGEGDIVQNCFAYHMTPGGFVLDEGARAAGAQVFPAGIGNTEQQVEAAAMLKPTAYAGTPDYLKTILDRGEEMGRSLKSFKKAIVSGGALFPSLRVEYRKRGVKVFQCYATAELGIIAYETAKAGRLLPGMIVNENLIVEIVRPGTGEPVEPGEVGELVVTNFNPAYPLIRFGTGDLTAILEKPSPCGRTNSRIQGWMGRADQRTKIKGMFVDPKQVSQIMNSAKGIRRARLVVTRKGANDVMTLFASPHRGESLEPANIEKFLMAYTKLKGRVEIVDDLPNDGKLIDDQRDYNH